MSDNKTPISIVLGIIEKKYDESPCNDDYECGYCNALNESIQTLKSHLALEEEGRREIKTLTDKLLRMIENNYAHQKATEMVNEYFNQKFKPE